MKKQRSFIKNALLIYTVSIAIPVIIFALFEFLIYTEVGQKQFLKKHQQIVGGFAERIKVQIARLENRLDESRDFINLNKLTREDLYNYLLLHYANDDRILMVQVLDETGQHYLSYPATDYQGFDFSSHPIWKHKAQDDSVNVDPIHYSIILDKRVLTLSTKLNNGQIILYISLEFLESLLRDGFNFDHDFVVMYDSYNQIVATSKYELGKSSVYSITNKMENILPLRELYHDLENDTFFYFDKIDALDCKIMIAQSEEAVFGFKYNQVILFHFALLIFTIIATIVGILFFRRPLESINVISKRFLAIAEGNFEYTATDMHFIEFDQLNRNFTSMASKIQDRERQIKDLNRDLERKIEERTQELIAANEDLSTFAHAVSHDLKAPLRAMATLIDFVQTDKGNQLSQESSDYLALIKQRSVRLTKLIEDILSYAKISKENIQYSVVDLKVLLEEIIHSVSNPNQVLVKLDAMPTDSFCSAAMSIIFQNLISNAFKFSRKSGGKLSIGHTLYGNNWYFTFTDNGIGIDPKHHKSIFDVFTRLNNSDDYEGSGIGLSSVAKVIEKLGGRIEVKSGLGEGTTFTVVVPHIS